VSGQPLTSYGNHCYLCVKACALVFKPDFKMLSSNNIDYYMEASDTSDALLQLFIIVDFADLFCAFFFFENTRV